MALSRLERWLSYYVRALLPHVLSKESSYRMAYVFSLVSAMCSGFVTLVALYSKPWHGQLHYSSWQVNLIVSAANLGMYLTPPILGVVADDHGPIALSTLAIGGFIPSYACAGYLFNHPESSSWLAFRVTLVAFLFIGISTSALYFSALLTCAKLYPERKLLSISLPTTCYGISSVIGSQLLRMPFFWSKANLDLGRVFSVFAWLYAAVGLLAWVATGTVSLLHHSEPHDEAAEQEPLLPVPAEERARQKDFFKDHIAYLLAFSMLLALGPLEMFVADMGSLGSLIVGNSAILSNQLLSVYAVSSTVTRLLTGLATDVFAAKKISPKWILIFHLLLAMASQVLVLLITSTAIAPAEWQVLSMGSMMGAAYGGLYTIYPTVVLIAWGDKLFGTAYGSMMVAPAIGAAISCLSYAKVYDALCTDSSKKSSACIAPVYKVTATQLACSLAVTLVAFRAWKRRNVPL
ncbi:hypothetical protein HG536_0E01480 [Torulaspora globosa]|uniref:Probable transporter MCH1 n=1 Tax=Torulaspora globosa TaxID=48254 RepID=A0A7G3ZIA1_9SACH|nr:uncharacterized protein HG536_0E01480 [Torulaspora globosa]QLL33237.1 hypothetical protein HG536_0E01480 [Torulaspora globosa]